MIEASFTVADLDDLEAGVDITDSILEADGDVPPDDLGRGSLKIPLGASLPTSPIGRAVVFHEDGIPAHAWVGEVEQPVELARGEERAMVTGYNGRGLVSLLDRYVVRPTLAPGKLPWSPRRTFSAHSPEYTAWTSWGDAKPIAIVGLPSARWTGYPAGYPRFVGVWIGPDEGDDLEAPVGHWFWNDEFEVASTSLVAFFFAADNRATVFLQGFEPFNIFTVGNAAFAQSRYTLLVLSPGTYRIGGKVSNYPDSGVEPPYGEGATTAGNPTGVLGVAYRVDASGALTDVLWETSAAAKVLSYPDAPPGMTAPEILDVLIAENIADGIEPAFTVAPQDGETFEELETVTVDVGEKISKILVEDFTSVYVDWHIPPTGLELQLWTPGGRGGTPPVVFEQDADPRRHNLTDLSVSRVDAGTDCLLLGYEGGFIRSPSSGGTRMAFLSTKAKTSREAELAGAYILGQPDEIEEVSVDVAPHGAGDGLDPDRPGVDFDNGDEVTAIAQGTYVRRVAGWSYRFSDEQAGEPRFDLTLGDRIPTDGKRIGRLLASTAPGALNGTAPLAKPMFEAPPFGSTVKPNEVTFEPIGQTLDPSPAKYPMGSGNMYAVACSATVAGSSETTFEFWVDGVDCLDGNGELPIGSNFILIPVDPIVFVFGGGTALQALFTSYGSGASGFLIEPRFIE